MKILRTIRTSCLERDLALNRVVTDRDALGVTVKTQMDALEEKSRNCIHLQGQLDTAHRELKRRDEEMKQLSLQWEILLRTIRDLRTKATELDVARQQIALANQQLLSKSLLQTSKSLY